jgi:hypothetical protein
MEALTGTCKRSVPSVVGVTSMVKTPGLVSVIGPKVMAECPRC